MLPTQLPTSSVEVMIYPGVYFSSLDGRLSVNCRVYMQGRFGYEKPCEIGTQNAFVSCILDEMTGQGRVITHTCVHFWR